MPYQVSARLVMFMLVVAAAAGCSGSPGRQSTRDGWIAIEDPTGSCHVSAPAGWQLGRDFYLERRIGIPGPGSSAAGGYAPEPQDLWPSTLPEGDQYQLRTAVVHGDIVCSVWRVKAAADFSSDEKAVMDEVGRTLQVVEP